MRTMYPTICLKEISHLYIDVGGKHRTPTFFSNGEFGFKQSFNIGTIRLLKHQVSEAQWDEMKSFIKTETKIQEINNGYQYRRKYQ